MYFISYIINNQSHDISIYFSCSNSNGKEKDYESGFHYYGVRYYWSEVLTGWLSVDPLADKYPSISPYTYCAWNPVKLIDPDGRDTVFSFACNTKNTERNESNKKLLKALQNIGDSPLVAISMHGSKENQTVEMPSTVSGDRTVSISAAYLAEWIKLGANGSFLYLDNLDKKKQTIIVLYSCYTGYGDNSFGQQLSKNLELSIVIAPAGAVWAGINSDGQTTIENAENIGTAEKPVKGPRCSWNIFVNGKKVMSFRHPAPQAWINKQGGINAVINKINQQNE